MWICGQCRKTIFAGSLPHDYVNTPSKVWRACLHSHGVKNQQRWSVDIGEIVSRGKACPNVQWVVVQCSEQYWMTDMKLFAHSVSRRAKMITSTPNTGHTSKYFKYIAPNCGGMSFQIRYIYACVYMSLHMFRYVWIVFGNILFGVGDWPWLDSSRWGQQSASEADWGIQSTWTALRSQLRRMDQLFQPRLSCWFVEGWS